MSDRLLIRLQADGQLGWVVQDAQGRALSGANAGAPAPATIARARRVIVLVPSEHVVLLETDAVSARRAQLARAVPFALEDQLASPVEDLHFALPERIAGSRLGIAVVSRAILRGWLDTLTQHGIRADVIIPDSLAMPLVSDAATVLVEPTRSVLRWSPTHACSCETAALAQWLDVVAPSAVQVYDFRQAPPLTLPVPVARYHERQSDPLAFLAAQLAHEPALNLLQGEFAPSHRHLPVQKLWRRAAVLAAASAILGLVHAGGDYLRLKRESDRLELAQRDVLRASLPESADVAGDPRQIMQSVLTRMRGDGASGGLLPLLERIGPVLASTTRISLKGMEFRNATLELGLRAPDVPALDLVREQVASLGGLKAEVTAATTSDKGVEGRLRISEGKP
ncbi:MAG TPA: type II secretion system protein GspL [Rudaea sp.]|nr:type II secretion system protein GspL [Rudaea sp.]